MTTKTLWDLASHPLLFTSYSSEWGNAKSVTSPGSGLVELSDAWMADRCVLDPNLLDALYRSVCNAFTPIRASERLVARVDSIREQYEGDQIGANLESETNVKDFLMRHWILQAESLLNHFVTEKKLGLGFRFEATNSKKRQQPDIHALLVTHDNVKICAGLIEIKSEGIVRKFWEGVVDRGKGNVKVDWQGCGRWDTVDEIIVKVAAYLAYYKLPWLCWTAVSHLLVFRLVRNPAKDPYLVVSDVAQVQDTRVPLRNVADARIGERWLPAILGCALAGIAETCDLNFDFDIENATVVAGPPTLTPREIEEQSRESSSSSEGTRTSSDDNWTPGPSGRARVAALLMFSSASGPRSLAAPLILSSPSRHGHQNLPRDDRNEEMPYGLWERRVLVSSSIPKLEVSTMLGEGSTGAVYEGLWENVKVAVKIAEGVDERKRLENESGWYVWLSQQGFRKVALPTFVGWYRHSSFDLLVMSHEGDPVASWDELRQNERYDLFSTICELHQAGVRHGDIEPRNVLRSRTGKMCLVDLSEASEHRCRITRSNNSLTFSDKRILPNIRLCEELESLCIALGLRHSPRIKYTLLESLRPKFVKS